ncbi:integrase [Bartonella sp. CL434QHHD]|uniref:integrase n=1 Tax=Bartonella sp. CL434QHHD TaxID=3243529 RepID=UPI0035CF6F99
MEEKCQIFYKTLCQTTTIIQQTLRFLILTGVCTNLLRYILKEDPIEGNIWTMLSSKL